MQPLYTCTMQFSQAELQEFLSDQILWLCSGSWLGYGTSRVILLLAAYLSFYLHLSPVGKWDQTLFNSFNTFVQNLYGGHLMLIWNSQNEWYSLKCQDTTEVQDIRMQQHLKKFGYYYYQSIKDKIFFLNTLTCFQCIGVFDEIHCEK